MGEKIQCSVIVPFYEGRKYLNDMLDGLCEQQLSLEVLLIADHGEPVEDILLDYRERLDIRFYEHHEQMGVAAARNLGVTHARGEYIYFHDADDYLEAGALDILYRQAKREDADVMAGHIRKVRYKRISYLAGLEQEENAADSAMAEPSIAQEMERWRFRVLHACIRRSYYLKKELTFDEANTYDCDMPVMAALLAGTEKTGVCMDAVYLKRSHDDPLHLPSLEQIGDMQKPQLFLTAYKQALQAAGEEKMVVHSLQRCLVDYLLSALNGRLQNQIANWEDSVVQSYQEAVTAAMESQRVRLSAMERRMLRAFAVGKTKKMDVYRKCLLLAKRRHGLFGSKAQRSRLAYLLLFKRLSVKKNYIVFESYLGRYYSDSPRALYEYIISQYPGKYKCIWAINEKRRRREVAGKPVIVKRESLRYYYYVARAKYWINNMRQDVWLDKKDGMVFLETWHGTPLKKLFFDMDEVHSSGGDYKMEVFAQTRKWDYLISDNPFSTEVFSSAFALDKSKILEYGYPRNDILYAPDKQERAVQIKECLGIPVDKKVILYAPTWRDDEYYQAGAYKFHLELDIDRMRREFSDEYVILLRTHYLIADKLELEQYKGFAYNGSDHGDISELYLISDICITDYSSVFFDYANLRRPTLFFVYDIEKYRDMLRGFYIDMETEVPGPLLRTNDEVIDAIRNIDEVMEKYREKEQAFYRRFCCRDDGNASKRIYDKVFLE